MKQKMWIIAILVILLSFFVANSYLSFYIQEQKELNMQRQYEDVENCFSTISEGGCATIQTSVYADTFGISNPLIGMFYFPLLSVIMVVLIGLHAQNSSYVSHLGYVSHIVAGLLIAGSLFSIWLLYVQFLILKTTCIYCLWVDGLMIGATVLFLGTRSWIFPMRGAA